MGSSRKVYRTMLNLPGPKLLAPIPIPENTKVGVDLDVIGKNVNVDLSAFPRRHDHYHCDQVIEVSLILVTCVSLSRGMAVTTNSKRLPWPRKQRPKADASMHMLYD